MTSRERVKHVLDNRKPDRIPFNFWMDRDLMRELDEKICKDFRIHHYGADVIETFPQFPFFTDFDKNAVYVDDGKTRWMQKYPVATVADLVNATYFDPCDPEIYQQLKDDRANFPDKALFAFLLPPLEILFNKIGMEQLFYDIADYPDIMDDVCEKTSQVLLKMIDEIAKCDVDVLYMACDICSTKGAIMSEETLRRFCFEPLKKLVQRAHELGLPVFYHTDGNVMDVLHLFPEYGIDGINPFQGNIGNDPEVFIRDYGNKLMLYGGIDNCFTIPDGTVDDVRAHIENIFATFGKNGRFIMSSHDIPAHVPIANIDVMVESIKKCTY